MQTSVDNRLIIIPSFWKRRFATWGPDSIKLLFWRLRDDLGFHIEYTDYVKGTGDNYFIIVFATPHHGHPHMLAKNLLQLSKKNKLIYVGGDLQCYDKKRCSDMMRLMFDRYDAILSPYHDFFMQHYGQYTDKYVYFPHFFAPYERYASLSTNPNPIRKCFLSGEMKNAIYPFRKYVKIHAPNDLLDALSPPYKGCHNYIKECYAKLLNSYSCCVTSTSIFGVALKKHFEIPAAGSLLLSNDAPDLEQVGLIADRHYVAVNYTNVLDRIEDCIKNPEKYAKIKKCARDFVLAHHSVENRLQTIKGIIERIDGG